MPARYLLDTNIVSYIIKGNIPRVRVRLLRVPVSEVAISVITEAELRFGLARKPEATNLKIAVEEFLRRVDVLPWDSACAGNYGLIRAALEENGEPMGNLDLMIAAHAVTSGAVLVTNGRVFKRVKGLKIEDWSRS